ncbi:MAG: hypothetical protein KDI55_02425 [Anaerolineae bacterium]|nr:hypothetical protein [Anaerolineae bacterium]MCP5428533.1 hypothetical protein [Chromatiaceae bacterium]
MAIKDYTANWRIKYGTKAKPQEYKAGDPVKMDEKKAAPIVVSGALTPVVDPAPGESPQE